MPSIGELFVKLGFDVDDTKLKTFNDGIQSSITGILQLAGISASVAGFVALSNQASDTALKLRNLTTELGANQDAAQRFVGAWRVVNPLGGAEQGLQSYQHILQYIANVQRTGQSQALAMLGVPVTNNMTPEYILAKLRANYEGNVSRLGVGNASKWIADITGTADAVNILRMSEADYKAAGDKGIFEDKDRQALVQYREDLQQLSSEFDVFAAHLSSSIMPRVVSAMKSINAAFDGGSESPGKKYHSVSEWYHARGVAGMLVDSFAKGSSVIGSNLGEIAGFGWAGLGNDAERKQYVDSHPDVLNDLAGKYWWAGGAFANHWRNIGADGSSATGISPLQFFTSKGWSANQSQGIIDRLIKESNLNPGAVGDNGQAYGAAQWHPDRQANFEKWLGKDIHGSTLMEQLAFVNYELTQGNEHKAGDLLKNTSTRSEAYDSFTRNYERPAITQNNTINVNSTAPAHEVAEQVNGVIQQHVNSAYSQTNLGPQY